MKPLLYTLLIIFSSTMVIAQTSAPKTEYLVSLSKNEAVVKPGESAQITLNLAKSKTYSKSKVNLGVSSTLPEGIKVSFDPAEGVFESSTVTIHADETAKEGEYQIIIRAVVNKKIKGSILKLSVSKSGLSKEAISVN